MFRPLFPAAAVAFSLVTAASARIDFAREVRPILADACFNCHGFDAESRKADLRLDTFEGATVDNEGVRAIVPGKPDESELVYRITADDADDRMPPAKHSVQLTAAQIDTLKQWIVEGGEYAGHWAFEPIDATEIGDTDRQAIDVFVDRGIAKAGLMANGQADRHTLVRRLSYDLTGLPPTPEEVQQFVSDPSPEAYGKLVDRLLASPRYGERMAMWWLDGARYADSHGFQADWERYQWPWRDWVIGAFNRNQPFDQFTVEQLAGDMLPDATTEQVVATGFNRNHRINTEGGSLDAEWLVENVIDRVETVGAVWLGLTLGCARCHDHKYDPISQKEFYQLFAYFHNVAEQGKGPGKQGNFEPIVKVPTPELESMLAKADADLSAAQAELRAAETKAAKEAEESPPGTHWRVVEVLEIRSTGGAEFTRQDDGSYLASGDNPETDRYRVIFDAGETEVAAIMIEALPDPSMVNKSVGRASNGNFVLTEFQIAGAEVVEARATYQQENWPAAASIDGKPNTGWAVDGNTRVQASGIAFYLKEPVAGVPEITLEFSAFAKHSIGRPRISVASEREALLPGEKKRSPEVEAARERVAALKKSRASIDSQIPSVMIMREMPVPRDTFVLERGQYDRPGEKVGSGLPAAFPAMPEGAPNNRLGFAKWVVSPENPLTARVQANRIWELLFGQGLVRSSENLGTQAEPPSHPELLDWLAEEFLQSGWDVKELLKTIVTSDTYKRSSKVTPAAYEADPKNLWLARGPRFRVQAEMVRDSALSMAGLLEERVGGPSVYPYQPQGIWSEFNFYGNLRNYKHATGENLYRRSLYTIWKRTAAPPAMTLFDMPGREICVVKRSRTNTPLQALALMNDVTYVEASRAFAERMITEGGTDLRDRLAFGFKVATAREATEAELVTLGRGYQRRIKRFKSDPDAATQLINQGDSKPDPGLDPAELAALTTVASVILNLDETITKE